MNTILVWVLVTVMSPNSPPTYSPYLADLESCQLLAKNMPDWAKTKNVCVQIRVAK